MVRLQLLSRNMKQTILVDESYPELFHRVPAGVIPPKQLSPPELIPESSMAEPISPPGLAGAGMSRAPQISSGSGGNQQHYCLRWNNHQHNLLGVLESVLASQQHADVSLFCEGHVLRVHKLVLLASSSHFERILEATPAGQQPVIILDGTRYADLRALIDYMYRGEVNIEQEQLTSLLQTAETLKIKGLAGVANKEEEDRGGGNGGGGGGPVSGNGGIDHGREGMDTMLSPPTKRPKQSPNEVASNSVTSPRDLRESRDHLPMDPRDFPRDVRDGPRDHISREITAHFGIVTGSSYPLPRRPHSPSPSVPTSNTLNPAKSLLYSSSLISRQSSKSPAPNISSAPYFSTGLVRSRSPHQFDPAPGSSIHPPRTSPSPVPEHTKIVSQISMPPFPLPFSIPLLHESKKMLDRTSHKILPSHYDTPRDERDNKDYLPPSWPPRGAEPDLERERELREREREFRERERDRGKEHEREWERERIKTEVTERIQLSHSQMQQHSQQEQLTQQHLQHHLQQRQQQVQPSQNSPIQLPHSQHSSSLPRLEILDKDHQDPGRRSDEDKFSGSPDKDNSFSPPDDTNSISSKTEYTPEGEPPEEDEDSSNGGSIREGHTITGNGEISSSITSTATNGRPPLGTTATTTGPPTPQSTSLDKKNAEMVKCPYCPRSYRHQNNLRTHIRCFHKGVRIPCPICHRGFTRWFTVRCHIAREHQNVDFSRPENLPAQLRRALYPPFAE